MLDGLSGLIAELKMSFETWASPELLKSRNAVARYDFYKGAGVAQRLNAILGGYDEVALRRLMGQASTDAEREIVSALGEAVRDKDYLNREIERLATTRAEGFQVAGQMTRAPMKELDAFVESRAHLAQAMKIGAEKEGRLGFEAAQQLDRGVRVYCNFFNRNVRVSTFLIAATAAVAMVAIIGAIALHQATATA